MKNSSTKLCNSAKILACPEYCAKQKAAEADPDLSVADSLIHKGQTKASITSKQLCFDRYLFTAHGNANGANLRCSALA